jgi:hypothetical protein
MAQENPVFLVQIPMLLKLTDFGSKKPIYINASSILSVHRPPGASRTDLKGVGWHEHVIEDEATIVKAMKEWKGNDP